MSNNANVARSIQAKLERVRRKEKEIIQLLIGNPHCMDGDPRKNEVYCLAISHLEAKRERTKTGSGIYNSSQAILLQMSIDDYEEAEGTTERLKRTLEIIARLLMASDEELKCIPDELKENAFAIAVRYLTESGS